MRGIIEPSILTCLHKLFYTPHEEEITNLHSTVVTTEGVGLRALTKQGP